MRANYKTLCIRFRTDSENHMEAYELLDSMKIVTTVMRMLLQILLQNRKK